jgi:hypothetical protein
MGPQGNPGITTIIHEYLPAPPPEKGEKGDKGDIGEPGPAGITTTVYVYTPAPPGERGPQGEVGPVGNPGKDGRDGTDAWYMASVNAIKPGTDRLEIIFRDGPLANGNYILYVGAEATNGKYYTAVILERKATGFVVGLIQDSKTLFTVPTDFTNGVNIDWFISLKANAR